MQRAVTLTLKNVLDIPEVQVVKLVRSIHGYGRPSGVHDMQLDATLSDAEVSSIMAACVSYPSSDAALRLAIKEQLNNAESIIPILVIVDDWLAKISSRETSLESPGQTTAMAAPLVAGSEADIPPLEKVRSRAYRQKCLLMASRKDFGVPASDPRCDICDAASAHTVPPASPASFCTPTIRDWGHRRAPVTPRTAGVLC
jgi:hypothetical protein